MAKRAPSEPATLEDAFAPEETRNAESAVRDERRIAPRVVLERAIRYRFPTIEAASTWEQGLVVNLSETGGAFLVDGAWDLVERIENEEWVPLDVELIGDDGGGTRLRLRAELVWVQPDGGGGSGVDKVGASFGAVSEDDRARLRELLQTAAKPAS